ncbi:hypothetical protein M3Y99_00979700 [Aphelenchoides fujianensis]|nr:hypothetical protein M3Y99_00979700 [Aphelenchoides fujianensis]
MWFLMYRVYAVAYVVTVYISYRLLRTFFALLHSIVLYLIIPQFYRPGFEWLRPRWTVVSGGTDGIGKAYMFELARRGLRKFVLVGRNPKKLEAVKNELEADYNAQFISCVLAPMERNGGGQIVVLSSSQGFRPIPLLAAYSAAKSLISFICEAVDREYKTINVQCLTPALIATKMTYYQSGSLFVVTPQNFCRQAVNTLGLAKITSGCFNHEIQMLLRHLFPWSLLKYLIMPVYWRHQKRMIKLHGPASMAKGNEPTEVKTDGIADQSLEKTPEIAATPKAPGKTGIPRRVSLKSTEKAPAAEVLADEEDRTHA